MFLRDTTIETRSLLASQIARTLSIFSIDEVVILSSTSLPTLDVPSASTDPTSFLLRLLSYLETPPYMRDRLFQPGKNPIHPDLTCLSALPSPTTSLPHHLASLDTPYREGVTLKAQEEWTYHRLVNCGLPDGVLAAIPDAIPKSTRVTLKLTSQTSAGTGSVPAEVVAPSEPREETGLYTGYEIRSASSLISLFEDCPYEGGYDISMLMSDSAGEEIERAPAENKFQHLLLAFGRQQDFDAVVKNDTRLGSLGIASFADLFDSQVDLTNGLPLVGQNMLRTEELVWMGLAGLKPLLAAQHK